MINDHVQRLGKMKQDASKKFYQNLIWSSYNVCFALFKFMESVDDPLTIYWIMWLSVVFKLNQFNATKQSWNILASMDDKKCMYVQLMMHEFAIAITKTSLTHWYITDNCANTNWENETLECSGRHSLGEKKALCYSIY